MFQEQYTPEDHVLAAACTCPKLYDEILELGMKADYILDPLKRRLFFELERLEREGSDWNIAGMSAFVLDPELRQSGYCGYIFSHGYNQTNLYHWVRLCREAWAKKVLPERLSELQANGMSYAAAFEQAGHDIAEQLSSRSPKSLSAVAAIDNAISYMEDILASKVVATSFPSLTEAIGGYRAGTVVTVAAGSGVGKTTFACQELLTIVSGGTPAVFFTNEMSNEQLMIKIISNRSGVAANTIKTDLSKPEILGKVFEVVDYLKSMPFFMNDTSHAKLERVLKELKRLSKKGVKVALIDYIQLMSLEDDTSDTRPRELSLMMEKIHAFAQEHKVCIILLAQLKRDYSDSDDHSIAHIQDSAGIAQSSDVVLFLKKREQDDGTVKYALFVVKNRDGAQAQIALKEDLAVSRFVEVKIDNFRAYWNGAMNIRSPSEKVGYSNRATPAVRGGYGGGQDSDYFKGR